MPHEEKPIEQTEIKGITPQLIWLFVRWLVGCTCTVVTAIIVGVSYLQNVIVDGRVTKVEVLAAVNTNTKRLDDLEGWRAKVTAYYLKPENKEVETDKNN